VPAQDVVVAVDIGGTRVKAALVDRDGTERVAHTLSTPAGLEQPGAVVDLVVDLVEELGRSGGQTVAAVRPVACGVVLPGLVDDARGVALYSANLGWRDLPLGEPLSQRLEMPVALGHDVRAGLLAEARLGAARGAQHALFVPVGTGIAGALMVDGHVLVADGFAGELGHLVVDVGGPLCGCGARGCLEAVASAAAVEKAYAARTGGSLARGERLGADRVAALVAAGDPDATAVWEAAAAALARALVTTVTITGVDLVLVGGGLAQSGELLLDPVREAVRAQLTFQRMPTITAAVLGDRAGCLGAALLAWDLG
jgi:glucokinase